MGGRTGPPGLEDVPGAPGSVALPAECNFVSSSGDVYELECPVLCVPLHAEPAFCVGASEQVTTVQAA